jgi:hypothetical protein
MKHLNQNCLLNSVEAEHYLAYVAQRVRYLKVMISDAAFHAASVD